MPNFEQPSTTKEENKEAERTAFETKDGEKLFARRVESPEDPQVEKIQEMLETHLGKEEVDPIEVMKQSMTGKMETGEEVPPYLVHVAENSKGEIKGVQMGAVVETVNDKREVSEKSGVLLDCYSVVSPEMRNQGIWKELFRNQEKSATKDAERRGLGIKGFMAEAHNDLEPILNQEGVKRAYIKTKDGSFRELPYEQPPLDWNPKTGKPGEDAGIVPEHLMLKLTSGKNGLSGKELMEMVRGMYLYNNYREEEYFKTPKAYERHTGFVKGIEQKLTDFIGKRKVQLLSGSEREAMKNKGIKFIEHRGKEDRAETRKAARVEKMEQKKGWKEHFGGLAEVQLAREKAERELAKEKKAIESAKIPEKGMKTEEILKEAGIEKPAASFEEFQKRLAEKLEKERTYKGERLSEGDKLMMARNSYLAELGYSVRYKGLLLDKAEILDEKNEAIADEKGKPIEFKSFYFSKTERSINDFLKERLKEKLEGRPAKELTEEEMMEKAVKAVENARTNREEKISFLQKTKIFGKEKLGKLVEGLTRLNLGEKLGILRRGKKLAVECGKDLAAIGLTPAMVLEQVGRRVVGEIQTEIGEEKKGIFERRIEAIKEMGDFPNLLELLQRHSQKGSEKIIKGYNNIHEKGKILRFIEAHGGRLGKAMGERITY